MAEVDADDDTIRRFVVMHYRYDADRRELRNVVVTAFDDETEFNSRIDAMSADLRGRRTAGDLQDPRERISGVVLEANERVRQRNARLLRRAFQRGVVPHEVRDLPLPPSVAIVQSETNVPQ